MGWFLKMNRLLIFVHYNIYNSVSDYIFYMLKEMKPLFKRVVFISNSPIPQEKYYKIKEYANKIIQRPNKGFDFGAWRDGLLSVGWDNLNEYDSITLMNDTCFGPIFSMKEVYGKMEKMGVDFWGITLHRSTKKGMPGNNAPVPEHIQSYFMVFNKKVCMSAVFKNFWNNIVDYDDVNKVIQHYETQLTKYLNNNGFTYKVYIKNINNLKNPNISFYYPDKLLKEGSPFVKIKSFNRNNNCKSVINSIKKLSDYPIELIYKHLNTIFSPNINVKVENKCIIIFDEPYKSKINLKLAVHYHVVNIDGIQEVINIKRKFGKNIDIYITTDSNDKKEYIQKLVIKNNINPKEILVVKNKGRDILPWFLLNNKLCNYDVVGHFHNVDVERSQGFECDCWCDEIYLSLLSSIDKIQEVFFKNPDIGLIIPEIPYCFKMKYDVNSWGDNRLISENLWKRMNCKKELNFDKLKTILMPYGSMFWYRPEALKPLFDLGLSEEDFPEEPLPCAGTILHAIERLLVYVAWSQGYDFRIAIHKDYIMSGLEYNEIRPGIVSEILFLQNALIKKVTIIIQQLFYKLWKRLQK